MQRACNLTNASGRFHNFFWPPRRTQWLESRGIRIIRVRNQQLDEAVQAVVQEIEHRAQGLITPP